jgi:protein-disulfide isomerase
MRGSLLSFVTRFAVVAAACSLPLAAMAGEADPPAATVGTWVLPLSSVDKTLESQLHELEQKRYELRMGKVQEQVAEHLLALEAAARKKTVEQLAEEINASAPKTTDQDVQQFISQNGSRLPKDDPKLADKIRAFMTERNQMRAQAGYIVELARKYKAEFLLQPPEALRVAVGGPETPVRGNPKAKVTIVEFSDFECSYCRRAQDTLKEVEKQYGDKVRLIFRHYPLPMHPNAVKAAEASQCADDQGKFWPYHDVLFAAADLTAPALKAAATAVGLDGVKFDACLADGRHKARVTSDLAEGERLGITGTPTFFVNGVKMVGAVPLEEMRQTIEDELKR